MKIVIPFAKADEGNQPTIAAAVLLAVGLCSHHVTQRIDREGGVQYHKHSEETPQEEAADTALPATVPDA